jgi:hypothetical protein
MNILFFNLPNPFSRTMALGFAQPLREKVPEYISGGKARSASKDDNLTAIYEQII